MNRCLRHILSQSAGVVDCFILHRMNPLNFKAAYASSITLQDPTFVATLNVSQADFDTEVSHGTRQFHLISGHVFYDAAKRNFHDDMGSESAEMYGCC